MSLHTSTNQLNRTNEIHPLRVLIVDDSVVARTVLERIITANPLFVVAQKSANADQALAYLAHSAVDIILLDVEMPGQNGIKALPEIISRAAGAKVIILSSRCEEGSASAVEALAMGASDIMSKPGRGSFCDDFSEALLGRLGRIIGKNFAPLFPEPPIRLAMRKAVSPPACIGVGASTGGIHALGQLLGEYRGSLGVPILLTQHLPTSFIPFFATQLSRMTQLPVKVADQGDLLAPNHIYVAPGEANLCCRRTSNGRFVVTLSKERGAFGSLPAVDPMFSAMADSFGQGAVGIVLTGMGRDGTNGAEHIVREKGWVVVQDEASSVVWGMPGSVARAGLSTALLPPEKIMGYIAQRAAVAA